VPAISVSPDRSRLVTKFGARRVLSGCIESDTERCSLRQFDHHVPHSFSQGAATLESGKERECRGMTRPDDAEVATIKGGDLGRSESFGYCHDRGVDCTEG